MCIRDRCNVAGGFENELCLFAWRNISRAAQIAALRHQVVLGVHDVQEAVIQSVVFLEIVFKGLWPRREQDRPSALILRHVLGVSHTVPELFGDERQEWMKQAKSVR